MMTAWPSNFPGLKSILVIFVKTVKSCSFKITFHSRDICREGAPNGARCSTSSCATIRQDSFDPSGVRGCYHAFSLPSRQLNRGHMCANTQPPLQQPWLYWYGDFFFSPLHPPPPPSRHWWLWLFSLWYLNICHSKNWTNLHI